MTDFCKQDFTTETEGETGAGAQADPGRNLLVLDLDETLLHAAERRLPHEPDFVLGHYSVYLRPYLHEFIDRALKWFDVAIWTSSSEDYASAMVSRLFPDPSLLRFVWASNRCTRKLDPELQDYFWVKDFKKLKRLGYDLDRVLVVDDSPEKHSRNYGNLIKVAPFTGDQADRELQQLLHYLGSIRDLTRYRTMEKRNWRAISSQLAERSCPKPSL